MWTAFSLFLSLVLQTPVKLPGKWSLSALCCFQISSGWKLAFTLSRFFTHKPKFEKRVFTTGSIQNLLNMCGQFPFFYSRATVKAEQNTLISFISKFLLLRQFRLTWCNLFKKKVCPPKIIVNYLGCLSFLQCCTLGTFRSWAAGTYLCDTVFLTGKQQGQFSRKVYRKSVPGNPNVEIEHEVSTTGCLCAEQNTNRVATVEAAAVLVQSVIVGNTLNRPACGMHCCPNSKECTHSTCPSVTVFRKSLTSVVVKQCWTIKRCISARTWQGGSRVFTDAD